MSKTGGGRGTNQHKIKGTSQAKRGGGTAGESAVELSGDSTNDVTAPLARADLEVDELARRRKAKNDERAASQAKTTQLAALVERAEEALNHRRKVLHALIAHDVADRMKSDGLSKIIIRSRRRDGDLDLSYYVDGAEDTSGKALYDDDFDPEEYENVLYDHFSEQEILDTWDQTHSETTAVITADAPHPDYPTRQEAESARDKLLTD
ncbi:hypothetical protein [Nesterenkonia rhizosphaerae]|uniref:Uncharacterized protein n=1 Tax=Nesterenkonia rhizosphaerae TaxID=1348272 RepID=A0ABP9G0X2_9MICC